MSWDWSYTYLLLNLLTIAYPLLQSFEWRIQYARKWRHLFPAIFITAALFIAWDVWFTAVDVWHFNPVYLSGVYLANLPLEEWLFFLTVPFALVFIYECLIYFQPTPYLLAYVRPFTLGAAVLMIGIALFLHDQLYTLVTFLGAGVVLIFHWVLFPAAYQYRFWQAYLIHLIPFFGINGVLTALPVVVYNDAQHLGFRLMTVPANDLIYSLMLFGMNLSIYEWLRSRKGAART